MLNQTADGESCIAVNNTKFSPKKYTMTCRARKNSGNEGFLIVYNYVSPDNYSWFNLGGWNNTQHGLEQISDGGKAQMGTKAGSVETGRWYDIRIDVDGDSVACYLDGKLMFESKARKNVTPGLFTSAAIDEATGEMIVKVANTSATSTTADLRLKNFAPRSARAIRLKSANGKDENTLDQPTAVYPVEETLTVGKNGLLLDVPAYSLSIVRIKR
jgi:alpha-L-arabinofuranosidase